MPSPPTKKQYPPLDKITRGKYPTHARGGCHINQINHEVFNNNSYAIPIFFALYGNFFVEAISVLADFIYEMYQSDFDIEYIVVTICVKDKKIDEKA